MLRDKLKQLIAERDEELRWYVRTHGPTHVNAFAVTLLRSDIQQLAAGSARHEGTIRQWIGKLTRAHLGLAVTRGSLQGPGFRYTPLH